MNEDIVQRELAEWIMSQRCAGKKITPLDVDRKLKQIVERYNSTPVPELCGLTPEQGYGILFDPFGPSCAVQLRQLTAEEADKVPFLRQCIRLLRILADHDIKLSKAGYLPPAIVDEIYRLGTPEWVVEEFYKSLNESKVESVQVVRIVLRLAGILKVRKGVMSLTAAGRKLMNNITDLADKILLTALRRYNAAYFDIVEDQQIGNYGIAFTVYMLHKFGSQWRYDTFYEEKYATISAKRDSMFIYSSRMFERLFSYLGAVENRRYKDAPTWRNEQVRITPVFDLLFDFSSLTPTRKK